MTSNQNEAWEVVSGDALRVSDWIKREARWWQIQAIREYPKTRRLKVLTTGFPREFEVRRSTLIYKRVRDV